MKRLTIGPGDEISLSVRTTSGSMIVNGYHMEWDINVNCVQVRGRTYEVKTTDHKTGITLLEDIVTKERFMMEPFICPPLT